MASLRLVIIYLCATSILAESPERCLVEQHSWADADSVELLQTGNQLAQSETRLRATSRASHEPPRRAPHEPPASQEEIVSAIQTKAEVSKRPREEPCALHRFLELASAKSRWARAAIAEVYNSAHQRGLVLLSTDVSRAGVPLVYPLLFVSVIVAVIIMIALLLDYADSGELKPGSYAESPRRSQFWPGSARGLQSARGLGSARAVPPKSMNLEDNLPPSLCPAMILPALETCFAVSMQDLQAPGLDRQFNVVGLSGTPLLRAVLQSVAPGAPSLKLFMVGGTSGVGSPRSEPHATVVPLLDEASGSLSPTGASSRGQAFEIRSASGSPYGILQPSRAGSKNIAYAVTTCGEHVLQVVLNPTCFAIEVTVASGSMPLCSVKRQEDSAFSAGHLLVFRIPPKVDSVLVLSCALTVLIGNVAKASFS